MQDLLPNVVGNGGITAVLDIAAVDAEGRQPLLGVGRQDGSQIDGARPLGAVESPDRLGYVGIHIHGLRAVAPAGRDRERYPYPLAPELVRGLCGLGNATDTGVGNDALHRQAIGMTQAADELGH